MKGLRYYLVCSINAICIGSVFNACNNSQEASSDELPAFFDISIVDTLASTIADSLPPINIDSIPSTNADSLPSTDTDSLPTSGSDSLAPADIDTIPQINIDSIPHDQYLPKLFIQSQSTITSNYSTAYFIFIDATGHYADYSPTESFESSGSIRIRGNSTATSPKKPYNIKFENKKSLLGMGKAKKWVLLSNPFDPTLIRNKLIYDLAGLLSFDFSPKSYFAEVWLNGEYIGNYQICEKIEFKSNRIPYEVENGDFLFERDVKRNKKGVTYLYSPIDSVRVALNEPETPSQDQLDSLTEKLRRIESAIETKDIMEYMKYVDLRSMIDYYWIEEFVNQPDLHLGRHFAVHNDMLKGGPVWDYDLALGNTPSQSKSLTTNFFAKKEIWWKYLFRDPVFEKIAWERYLQIEPYFDNLANDNALGKNKIDSLLDFFGDSFRKNFSQEGWAYCHEEKQSGSIANRQLSCPKYVPVPQPTFDENITSLRNWITRRNEYIRSEAATRLAALSHIEASLESILAIQDSILTNR